MPRSATHCAQIRLGGSERQASAKGASRESPKFAGPRRRLASGSNSRQANSGGRLPRPSTLLAAKRRNTSASVASLHRSDHTPRGSESTSPRVCTTVTLPLLTSIPSYPKQHAILMREMLKRRKLSTAATPRGAPHCSRKIPRKTDRHRGSTGQTQNICKCIAFSKIHH